MNGAAALIEPADVAQLIGTNIAGISQKKDHIGALGQSQLEGAGVIGAAFRRQIVPGGRHLPDHVRIDHDPVRETGHEQAGTAIVDNDPEGRACRQPIETGQQFLPGHFEGAIGAHARRVIDEIDDLLSPGGDIEKGGGNPRTAGICRPLVPGKPPECSSGVAWALTESEMGAGGFGPKSLAALRSFNGSGGREAASGLSAFGGKCITSVRSPGSNVVMVVSS